MSDSKPFILALRPVTSSTVPAKITGAVLAPREFTVRVAFVSPLALDAVIFKLNISVETVVPDRTPVAGLKFKPVGGEPCSV